MKRKYISRLTVMLFIVVFLAVPAPTVKAENYTNLDLWFHTQGEDVLVANGQIPYLTDVRYEYYLQLSDADLDLSLYGWYDVTNAIDIDVNGIAYGLPFTIFDEDVEIVTEIEVLGTEYKAFSAHFNIGLDEYNNDYWYSFAHITDVVLGDYIEGFRCNIELFVIYEEIPEPATVFLLGLGSLVLLRGS